MTRRAERIFQYALGTGALAAALMLGGCGGNDHGKSQAVEMRDMEVVDGTVNDAMTDLDAVRSDGTALADNGAAGNAAEPGARPARRAARDTADEAEQNAEAVAAE